MRSAGLIERPVDLGIDGIGVDNNQNIRRLNFEEI